MNITDIVHFQRLPESYHRIEPFSATISQTNLTVSERQIIMSALVNAAHEIRRARCSIEIEPFYHVHGCESGESEYIYKGQERQAMADKYYQGIKRDL